MNLSRRSFLAGLAAALAAPVVVRADALMPIRGKKLITDALKIFVDISVDPAAFQDGSAEHPFRTITQASKWLNHYEWSADSTIYLAKGQYVEEAIEFPRGCEGSVRIEGAHNVSIMRSTFVGHNKERPLLEVVDSSRFVLTDSLVDTGKEWDYPVHNGPFNNVRSVDLTSLGHGGYNLKCRVPSRSISSPSGSASVSSPASAGPSLTGSWQKYLSDYHAFARDYPAAARR